MPVGPGISAQQGMLSISKNKKKSHGARSGEYVGGGGGGGGGGVRQNSYFFLSSKTP